MRLKQMKQKAYLSQTPSTCCCSGDTGTARFLSFVQETRVAAPLTCNRNGIFSYCPCHLYSHFQKKTSCGESPEVNTTAVPPPPHLCADIKAHTYTLKQSKEASESGWFTNHEPIPGCHFSFHLSLFPTPF